MIKEQVNYWRGKVYKESGISPPYNTWLKQYAYYGNRYTDILTKLYACFDKNEAYIYKPKLK